MSFQQLGVSTWLEKVLSSMAIHTPSAIQKACIPPILEGRDCIGGAKTGSGKTIAFAAPMLTKWSKDPFGICGLILTPTRELAIQIAEQFAALGSNISIKTCVIVGGVDMMEQAKQLKTKPHFVIATPGRLAQHIEMSGEDTINGLRRVKYLVLDEADRMLTKTFAEDLEICMNVLPDSSKRQTLLFTATVTDAVRALKEKPPAEGKKEPFMHEIAADVAVPSTLSQHYLFKPSHVKEAFLHSILTLEENEDKSAIIFVNRTQTAERLRRVLQLMQVRATSLHSEMPQQERMNAFGRFRAEAARVLIATDVASRGLDIPVVEMVINFDLPADADDYVHRVGRTARAGRKGDAISFVSEKDIERIQNIEERVGTKMGEYTEVNDDKVIKESIKEVSVAKRTANLDMDKEGFGERRKQHRMKNSNNNINEYRVSKHKKSKKHDK